MLENGTPDPHSSSHLSVGSIPDSIENLPLSAAPPISRLDRGGVAVIINGEGEGIDALRWAVVEASARRTTLRVVHPLPPLQAADPFTHLSTHQWLVDERRATEAVRQATDYAMTMSPHLVVSGHVGRGLNESAVVAALSTAGLIVTRRNGGYNLADYFVGASVWAVARRSTAPVIVVDSTGKGLLGDSAGRVVVFLTGTIDPLPALGFALRAAHSRLAGVTVVHRSRGGGSTRFFAAGRVDDAFRAAHDAFPEIDVRKRSTREPTGFALLRESAGAELLVVDSRQGRGIFRALRSSRYRSGVPVAVV